MLTLDFTDTNATGTTLGSPTGIALVQLHNELWRVTRPAGEVLGYVERFMSAEGARFRAKRLLVTERRFVVIGEFWAFDEAIDCFAW